MDATVSVAVEKLADFLIREVDFLSGVEDQVKWIITELKYINSFLKDAENRQDDDDKIHILISDLRDIACKAQDVVDTFYAEIHEAETSKRGKLKALTKKILCISGKTDLYDIGTKIKDLKLRVLDISRKREVYGINNIGKAFVGNRNNLRELRKTTSFADEEHFVGFEDDTKFLEEKIFLNEPKRSVISILGMGGLGKTTLARKLYNRNKDKFASHAWICVSQEWNTRDLLERIIKYINKDEFKRLENLREHEMESYIRNFLEGNQYLVVIDDMWHEQVWQSLKRALPENHKGSRIIVTTRIKDVAGLDQRTYVHELRFLRSDESWELFCKTAFPEKTHGCPQDLMVLGREMMEKCGGLPLAIIVLGGLLSRKEYVHEWQAVKDRIWRELKSKSIHVSSLLELSYKDLPHELQLCFLYLSIFPEDSEVDGEKLIRLWIAEDFIPLGESGMDLEELAENYLEELSGRSLIQVVERRLRVIKTCRVHDLLRDLAVNKAKDLEFLHCLDSTKASSARRIVFHAETEIYASLKHSNQQVRTLAFINNYNSFTDDYVKMLLKLIWERFKLLRVLELEGIGRELIEGKLWSYAEMGKLIYLKYLGLDGIIIEELPKSIGNLKALQTICVSSHKRPGFPTALPIEICKLENLRNLIGRFQIREGKNLLVSPILFGGLKNLRCLKFLEIHGWVKQKENNVFALEAFSKLQNLKILSVRFDSSYRLSVEPLFNCNRLVDLHIDGQIESLPEGMHYCLPHLKFLYLRYSQLEEDPMPALGLLKNLLILYFDYLGVNSVTCSATSFPQLEALHMIEISDVTLFEIKEGAMPKLKFLDMVDSKKQTFPERLRRLPRGMCDYFKS